MANLISLPFDVKLLIVRHLDLNDCLSFAQVSTECHDIVYYVFSHRAELDFTSVITDGQYVSLSDALFLQVLHAHTRVTCIRNFCIPRSFAAFGDLSHYLDLYWSLTFISDADPTIPNNDCISGTYVGHPQGQLQSIYYHGYFGAPTLQEGHRIEQIMAPFDDIYGFQITSENDNCSPPVHDGLNWSTTNIDAPYHLCSVCELAVIVDDSDVCSICTYVRAFLDDTDLIDS